MNNIIAKITFTIFLLTSTLINVGAQSKPNNCPTHPVNNEIVKDLINPILPPQIHSTDIDGDGLADIDEAEGDCDEDGIPNIEDPDSDNDGIIDGEDACPCKVNPCTNRKVFFVHGFAGSKRSWGTTAAWLQGGFKDVTTYNEDYSQLQVSVNAAANELRSYLEEPIDFGQPNSSHKPNFVIAHSLGGMVMRNVEQFYSYDASPIGGIITIGSGHLGANIATTKATSPHKIEQMLGYTCKVFLNPFIIDKLGSLPSIIAQGINVLDGNKVCDNLDDNIFQGVEKLLNAPIDPDLTLDQAASWPANTTEHNIALYGIEDDQVTDVKITLKDEVGNIKSIKTITVDGTLVPRFFGAAIKPPAEYDYFEADDSDNEGLMTFGEGINSYSIHQKKHRNTSRAASLAFVLNPWRVELAAIAYAENNAANKYRDGLEWFTKINFLWKEVIGGIQDIEVNTSNCECEVENYYGDIIHNEIIPYNGTPCENYEAGHPLKTCYRLTTLTADEYPTDGFLLAESTMAMPNSNYEPILMPGSNHFQMRNDSNLKKELERIFDNHDRPYFKLEKK